MKSLLQIVSCTFVGLKLSIKLLRIDGDIYEYESSFPLLSVRHQYPSALCIVLLHWKVQLDFKGGWNHNQNISLPIPEMVTINVEPVSKEKFVDLDKDKDDSMTSQPENNIQITKN